MDTHVTSAYVHAHAHAYAHAHACTVHCCRVTWYILDQAALLGCKVVCILLSFNEMKLETHGVQLQIAFLEMF